MQCTNSGIYTITTPSGKQYVGSAVNFKKRWSVHRSRLSKGLHANRHLQNAFDKYGADGFVFAKLIACPCGDLVMYEQLVIDALRPAYNIRVIAESNLGFAHSEQTKAKLSNANKGRNNRIGTKLSDETKAKISAAQKGKARAPFSIEWRAKLSAAHAKRKRTPATEAKRLAAFRDSIAKRKNAATF